MMGSNGPYLSNKHQSYLSENGIKFETLFAYTSKQIVVTDHEVTRSLLFRNECPKVLAGP